MVNAATWGKQSVPRYDHTEVQMIPLLVEILVQMMLVFGAAGLVLMPFWFFRTRGGSAQPRLLGNASEQAGFTLPTAAPTKHASQPPAAKPRR